MRQYGLGVWQKLVILLLALVLLASLGLFAGLSGAMAQQMADAKKLNKPIDPDKPHLFVLLSGDDAGFREALLAGARRTAEEKGMLLEVSEETGDSGAESYAATLDAAIDARVDGIILQPAWHEVLEPVVQRAVDAGIPLVTVGEDLIASGRRCHVGNNSFEFGSQMGRLAAKAPDGAAVVAVVYRGQNGGDATESSLKLDGLRDVAAETPGMTISRIEQGTNAFFGAEDTFRDILVQNPEVNVLVCMTARDTLAAAHTVLDLNRLLYVRIVGTDLTPEIQELLDKNIVTGTVARNPDTIGKESVLAMSGILAGEPVSDFVDVGLDVVRSGQ